MTDLKRLHERVLEMKHSCDHLAERATSKTEGLIQVSKASAYGEVTVVIARMRRENGEFD